MTRTMDGTEAYRAGLLESMKRILAIDAPDLGSAMDAATQLIAEAFAADKADVLFLEEATRTLVALGTSYTPMLPTTLHRVPRTTPE
jgi:hypothetical protein